jgi:hypothetical protein
MRKSQGAYGRSGRWATAFSHSQIERTHWATSPRTSVTRSAPPSGSPHQRPRRHPRNRPELRNEVRLVVVPGRRRDARPARTPVLPRGTQRRWKRAILANAFGLTPTVSRNTRRRCRSLTPNSPASAYTLPLVNLSAAANASCARAGRRPRPFPLATCSAIALSKTAAAPAVSRASASRAHNRRTATSPHRSSSATMRPAIAEAGTPSTASGAPSARRAVTLRWPRRMSFRCTRWRAPNAWTSRPFRDDGPKRTTSWISGRGITTPGLPWSQSYMNNADRADAVDALGAMRAW